MRRRRPRHAVVTPERLCRFVAAEWPESDPWEACRSWKEARRVFGVAHPGSLLGDVVDQLQCERRTRQEMSSWAGPDTSYRPRTAMEGE